MENEIILHENQFKLKGKDAFLKFNMRKDVMMITSTYTDPELRGNGYATKLTKRALEYADKNNFKVIPICGFVSTYMRKNKQFNHLLYQSQSKEEE